MVTVIPSGKALGATLEGLDLATPLLRETFGKISGVKAE